VRVSVPLVNKPSAVVSHEGGFCFVLFCFFKFGTLNPEISCVVRKLPKFRKSLEHFPHLQPAPYHCYTHHGISYDRSGHETKGLVLVIGGRMGD
jgi:hypothetical protein